MRCFGDQGAEEDDIDSSIDEDIGAIGVSEDDETTGAIAELDEDDIAGGALELETTGATDDDEAGGVTTAVVVPPRLKMKISPTMTITATMMMIQVLRFIDFYLSEILDAVVRLSRERGGSSPVIGGVEFGRSLAHIV